MTEKQQKAIELHGKGYNCFQSVACVFAPELDVDDSTIVITEPVPDLESQDTGIKFYVKAVVNPDNYTISLYLRPSVIAYVGHDNSNYLVTMEAGYLGVSDGGAVVTDWRSQAIPYYKKQFNLWMPEFTIRDLETNVRVYDGETIVLGGMIDDRNMARDDRWPVLGDVPFFGRFFSSQMTMTERRNLLVFVTARLINAEGMPIRRNIQPGLPDLYR